MTIITYTNLGIKCPYSSLIPKQLRLTLYRRSNDFMYVICTYNLIDCSKKTLSPHNAKQCLILCVKYLLIFLIILSIHLFLFQKTLYNIE